jgi:hypothetical protein
MMHLKVWLKKKEQAKHQISRCKEIIKIKEAINEMETTNQYKGSVKQEVGSLYR